MKIFRAVVTLMAIFALVYAISSSEQKAVARADAQEVTPDTRFIPGELVVGFDEIVGVQNYTAQAQALAGVVRAQVVDLYGATALLRFSPEADLAALAAQVSASSGVRYAEPNYIVRAPDDVVSTAGATATNFGPAEAAGQAGSVNYDYANDGPENWGWHDTGAEAIWKEKAASPVVCVLDSGIDERHPDLKGKVQPGGYDFVNDDKFPYDDNGHGTHVAGVIAALSNNKRGIAGISNGKVLAVKVLTAQNWGTTFDLAAGIRYCADNKTVRVLNMSLGGYGGSTALWLALDYAINARDKLAVVAAMNNSRNLEAYPTFPASWADPIQAPNGTIVGGAYGTNISQGLLAVGAARNWDGLWVDDDGDGADVEEEELYSHCAASFSNYGEYVEIVAPGVDILSTTPVSYPFYAQYFNGVSPEYEYYNGTSMATPHVAAAAARVMSLFKTHSASQIKTLLLDTGDLVTAVEDANFTDTDLGYDDSGYLGDAPYCWPVQMADSVHLNVAAAMGRTIVYGRLHDATTGLPLVGAKITVINDLTGKPVPGATITMKDNYGIFWSIGNVPVNATYRILVTKAGYTAGAQMVGRVLTEMPNYHVPNEEWSTSYEVHLNIPPLVKNLYQIVADWGGEYISQDLFLVLPAGAPSAVVGNSWLPHPDLVEFGNLIDFPYARWHRDGGWVDAVGSEFISVRKLNATNLYYAASGAYHVLMTDFGNGYLASHPPRIRVWDAGKMILFYRSGDFNGVCDVSDEWWHAMVIAPNSALAPTITDVCGDDSLFPYMVSSGTQGIPGSPSGKP